MRVSQALVRQALRAVVPLELPRYPVNLNAVAKALGARDILYSSRSDGFTLWDHRGATIHLAICKSDGRRRSTLAHECGHLFIDPIANTTSFQNAPERVRESFTSRVNEHLGGIGSRLQKLVNAMGVEPICDLVGRELMLPDERITHLASCWNGSITNLQALASDERVSLAMLTIAFNGNGAGRTLLSFRRTPRGEWLAIRAVGFPRGLSGRLTCPTLEELAVGGEWSERTRRIKLDGAARLEMDASVRVSGGSALVLVPRRDLGRCLANQ